MTRVQRYDRGELGGDVSRTSQGFLRIPGNLTRVGVLTYIRGDGSTFRELRHPDEVMTPKSIESLRLAPVTDEHPPGLISPRNVRRLQVGIVAEARADGRFIAGEIIVQDAKAIRKVEAGELRELSPGYTCRIDETPGSFRGERFDGIQRGIDYNHLAMGPREWGRSGPEVALHLDAKGSKLIAVEARADALHHGGVGGMIVQQADLLALAPHEVAERAGLDEATYRAIIAGRIAPTDTQARAIAGALDLTPSILLDQIPPQDRRDVRPRRKRAHQMDMTKITIDGVSYDVAQTAGQHIERAIAQRDGQVAEQTRRADAAEGERDAAQAELGETKTKLDAASDPKVITAAVTARVLLERRARRILGDELKLDAMSDREIRCAALVKHDDSFDAAGRSDDYLDARFDVIADAAPERSDAAAPTVIADALLGNRAPAKRTDGGDVVVITDAQDARAKAHRDASSAWQKPLRVSSGH